jgi:hypothetical protein
MPHASTTKLPTSKGEDMRIRIAPVSALLLGLIVLTACASEAVGRNEPIARSTSYHDLAELFEEWREFQKPQLRDGVPDYTPDAMARQLRGLERYRARLAAVDPGTWPLTHQVDYHLVRAEMNGLDFDHRVMRPWSRMPSFYKVVHPSDTDVPAREGQVMYGTIELWTYELPLPQERVEELRTRMRAIPAILEQARANLVEDARDLWFLGIRVKQNESRALESFAARAAEHHPALAEDTRTAKRAVDTFREWLEAEFPSKTGPSGIGIENYDWHLKHVQLVPYTWQEEVVLVRRELERAWGYLSLAENRNRGRVPLPMVGSEEEYRRRYRQAVRDFVRFLREQEVMTLSGFEEASLLAREGGFTPPERRREFFTQVNYRDLHPMRAHGTHWFDLARMETEPHPSPVRRVPLLYNIWASRAEGLATGFEEMMMEAGFLDEPQVRELVWVLLAQRAARALGELKMHANELSLEEAAKFTVEWTPHGWLDLEGNTVWTEGQLYLEQPSYGTSYVIGKLQLDRLLADRRQQLGADFTLRGFMDDLHRAGMIPVSLIRWEMTGLSDEINRLRTVGR